MQVIFPITHRKMPVQSPEQTSPAEEGGISFQTPWDPGSAL